MNEPAPLGPLGREEAIFNAAALLGDPAKRAIYLDLACENDAALRARIEKLLANDAGDDFFAQPLSKPVFPSAAADTLSAGAPEAQALGERIGRYKLLQKIGEGGLGLVYMAEQEEPVRRRVALKVIRLGMDTQSVIARFEAERQALALMDHPNIAKILDGGVTETGRPYFVMDLVQGLPITHFCDQAKLSTRGRLDLFREVCSAIQHAHQKGIIHRDIKPSNILVTLHGDKPVPKVIDFGIAKATQQRLTDKTLFTQFQQFMGTPAYVSPEQASLSGLDVDTRSDIYSLGVLLYELLTGKTPFDSKELLQAGLDRMRRTICEKEPPTPSTRVNTMRGDELTTTAQRRGIEAPKLISQLRGDLDWIVMKCLEKDRARRYETANGLATDIQRHLNNEPVMAGPPSPLYRFQKMVRRNRGVFTALGIILVLLAAGVGISAWEAVRARRAEANEARQRDKEQTEAAKSKQVALLLKEMLEGVGPSKAKGRDTTMLKEILDKTADRVGKELTNQPEVELELDTVLARTYADLGLYAQAEEVGQRGLALARALFGEGSAVTASAVEQLGEAQFQVGKYEQAESTLRRALQLRRNLLGNERREVAESLNALAVVLRFRGKLGEAEDSQREALALLRKLLGNEHADVGATLVNFTDLLREEGKLADAEKAGVEAVALFRKSEDQLALATGLYNLAIVLKVQGKWGQAEAMDQEALEIRRKLLDPQHPSVAESLASLAGDLADRGDGAGAESAAREALSIRRKTLGSEHPLVAATLYALGGALERQDKWAEAEEAFRQAVDLGRKAFGKDDPHVGWFLNDLAQVLMLQSKLSEAESAQREAVGIARRIGNEHPYTAQAVNSLATILIEQGKFPEGESAAREAVSIYEKVYGAEHPDLAYALSTLASALQGQIRLPEAEEAAAKALRIHRDAAVSHYRFGSILTDEAKLAEGEAAYKEALAISQKRSLPGYHVAFYLNNLAINLRYQGRLAEAETLAEQAVALNRKVLGQAHPGVLPSLNTLAAVLHDQGKLAEAEQLYRNELPATRASLAADSLPLACALAQWSETLVALGRSAEAEPLARQCLQIRERNLPGQLPTSAARTILGEALLGQKRYSESEPLLVSGYQEISESGAKDRPDAKLRLRKALERLVQLYEATKQSEQAADWKKKLAEFEATQTTEEPAPQSKPKPSP